MPGNQQHAASYKWQGPGPGKRDRKWAPCAACDTCPFGGYKFYKKGILDSTSCKCGAGWKNAADRKAAAAHANAGAGGAGGAGDLPKPKAYPRPKGNTSAFLPKPPVECPYEAKLWKQACDDPEWMGCYKSCFGENSYRFAPVIEESPATEIGRLAAKAKTLEEKIDACATKAATHARLRDEHSEYLKEAQKAGEETHTELLQVRKELELAHNKSNPKVGVNLVAIDPGTQKLVEGDEQLAAMLKQVELQKEQLDKITEDFKNLVSEKVASQQPPAAPPAASADTSTPADSGTKSEDADMPVPQKSTEEIAAEAEKERKLKQQRLVEEYKAGFVLASAAAKKARTGTGEETEDKGQCG